MTATETLTPQAILDATVEVLRRYGPAKATVLDVARVLGVSHGSVYRHFPSKASLRAAVTRQWLERAHAGLAPIAVGDAPPPERLRTWLRALFDAKRAKALGDPELFATYSVLTAEQSAVVDEHLADMVGQVARILAEGVVSGDFAISDVERTAQAVFDATTAFHAPVHAGRWTDDGIEDAFDAVVALVLEGLVTR